MIWIQNDGQIKIIKDVYSLTSCEEHGISRNEYDGFKDRLRYNPKQERAKNIEIALKYQYKDIDYVEIFPLKKYDIYGYKLNAVFLSSEDYTKEKYIPFRKKIEEYENLLASYLLKGRCVYGDCYIFDENKPITKQDLNFLIEKAKIDFKKIPKVDYSQVKVEETAPDWKKRLKYMDHYLRYLYDMEILHRDIIDVILRYELLKCYVKDGYGFDDLFATPNLIYNGKEKLPYHIYIKHEVEQCKAMGIINHKEINRPENVKKEFDKYYKNQQK